MTLSTQVYRTPAELDTLLTAVQEQFRTAPVDRPKGICGFDGFIDTFIRMETPATMAEFGPKVAEAAGISASYTVRHEGDKFGGNGPLITSALYGIYGGDIDLTYIGAMGKDAVLPIYQEALQSKTKHLYTLTEPAHSDCLEFDDGKVMLCDLRSCSDITWDRLLEVIGKDALDAELQSTDFIAAVNWGKLPHVGTIWKNLSQRLETLGRGKKEVVFFMDLAEFEPRPTADRHALIQLIGAITEQCRTLLSFNLKEAWQMGDLFGGQFHGRKDPDSVAELAGFLFQNIDVDRIIIHPNDGAACASAEGISYVPGPVCQKPLISTGAGDNFGGGCVAGTLLGLDDAGMLLAGVCASGYFVRTGDSPSLKEMAGLAEAWKNGTLPERL